MKRRIFSPREIILPKAKLSRSVISWGKFIMPILVLAWFFIFEGVAKAAEITVDTVWTKAKPDYCNGYDLDKTRHKFNR